MSNESLIIGSSRRTRHVANECVLLGPRKIPLVIRGESGAGKGVVALELHRLSKQRRFVRIAASELPPELIQAILAGADKGIYTSADRERPGLLETSEPLTVFLDDLQTLPMGSQPYLLDCLEGQGLRRVGGKRSFTPDIRWIFGTQMKLAELVAQRLLRHDLAARMGGMEVVLWPLRERRDDIADLIPHFLREIAIVENVEPPRIDPAAVSALRDYTWPNNVRQLRSCLHEALIRAHAAGTAITVRHLPSAIRGHSQARKPGSLTANEISAALELPGMTVARAAKEILKVGTGQLYRRMRELGMKPRRAA